MEPQHDVANRPSPIQARIDELWDWEDPASSERRFRAAAAATSQLEGQLLLTQAARALGMQGRHSQAAALLDDLPDGVDPELDVRLTLERGRVLNSGGHAADARPLFEEAHAAALAAGMEHLAIDALHMIAITAAPEEQAALNEQAIAMAERARDPRARQWLASLYNNLGWTRFDAGQLDEALRLFELALAERRKLDQPRETGIARWAVARALRALGRVDEALAQQQSLAADNAAAGVDDPYVDEELGECLLALGRADEARPRGGAPRPPAAAWLARAVGRRDQPPPVSRRPVQRAGRPS
jgi:tetratricopeptide (TPR) repeat protein